MCALSFVLLFALAHIVAWGVLGGGWRGAARAPFVVFVPAAALVVLQSVTDDAFGNLGATLGTLASWELGYFFVYLCVRICLRPMEPAQLAAPRK